MKGRWLEEDLEQFERLLLPGQPVADAFAAAERIRLRHVPAIISDHRVLIGILRVVTQHLLGFLYRYKRIFRSGLVDPGVERGEFERFEDLQGENDRSRGEGYDALVKAGFIEDGLIILAHGGVFTRADVEGVVDLCFGQGHAGMDRAAEIFDVEELVAVAAGADHGKTLTFAGPFVEDGEDAQAFWADE